MQTAVFPDLLRQQLHTGQTVSLVVSSASMSPLFRPHDQIFLEYATIAQLKIGDIVTVWLGDEHCLLTHRLIAIDEEAKTLILRGDRLKHKDHPIPFEALIGRVTAVQRNGRLLPINQRLLGALNHCIRLYLSIRRKGK